MNDELGRFLDRLTEVDGLLRESIKMQTKSAESQMQINHLLYALWRQGKGRTFGTALAPTKMLPPTTRELPMYWGEYRYTTDILELKNQVITGSKSIFSYEFGGAISEIVLLSDSTVAANGVYRIHLLADGKPIWNETYTNLSTLSDYFTDMKAYEDEDNNIYVVNLNNIFFNESVNLTIAESTATFTKIYAKIVRRLENNEIEIEE